MNLTANQIIRAMAIIGKLKREFDSIIIMREYTAAHNERIDHHEFAFLLDYLLGFGFIVRDGTYAHAYPRYKVKGE